MRRNVPVLAASALLAVPAAAWADSKLSVRGGVFYFHNEDAGVANRLTVDTDPRGRLHFADDGDPYGMNFPAPLCSPGRLNSAGNVVEVFCARDSSYRRVSIEAGPGEDGVAWAVADLPVSISGEDGADVLTSAAADDTIAGGQGNDAIDGGGGADQLLGGLADDTIGGGPGDDLLNGGEGNDVLGAGDGNDTLQTSDGWSDTVGCGTGEDTVVADQLDTLTDCEKVDVQQVEPVPGQSGPKDTAAPALRVGGSTRQRSRRTIGVLATVSEPAVLNASGFVTVRGINLPLRPASAGAAVGGAGATLRLALPGRARGRRGKARVTVTAVDAAGNTSTPRRITVALARR